MPMTREEWMAKLADIELRAAAAGIGEMARAVLGQWVTVAVLQGGPEIVRVMCEGLIGHAADGRDRRAAESLAKAGGVQ